MKEVFEKIIEKLEELRQKQIEELCEHKDFTSEMQSMRGHNILQDVKKIVQEIADEYNNGWIPCSERLPKVGERVLLQDFSGYITLEKCEKRKRVKGFTDGDWWSSANNYIAWQPLTEPYQPKGE